jgi:hypothetical protein
MLRFLQDRASNRKLRLFMVACCRKVWDILVGQERREVELVERYVEGEATREELAAVGYISEPWKEAIGVALIGVNKWDPNVRAAQLKTRAAILRDIIGPLPFRPVTVQPSWLGWKDGTVFHLAQSIYEDRRFTDLPILADALEDSGCTDRDILGHLRSPGPHVRGCWCLDLVLKKD